MLRHDRMHGEWGDGHDMEERKGEREGEERGVEQNRIASKTTHHKASSCLKHVRRAPATVFQQEREGREVEGEGNVRQGQQLP